MGLFCALILMPFYAGNNSDLLEQIEGLVAVWTKQIEQVLAESEQVCSYN